MRTKVSTYHTHILALSLAPFRALSSRSSMKMLGTTVGIMVTP